MKTLNPYKIKWVIISKNGKYISWDHGANDEHLLSKIKLKKGEIAHIITDKQYGLIQIDYTGKIKETILNTLVLRDGNTIYSIPVTTKQLNNVITND